MTATSTKEPTEDKVIHPYAKRLEDSLQTQRNMLTLLESKKTLLKETYEDIEEEGNKKFHITKEDQLRVVQKRIDIIRTNGEIDALKKVITEKENYYRGYMEQFVKDEEEVNKRFKHTVDIAKKSTKPNVQNLLAMVMWDRIEGDIEAKIALYKQLKKHV